MLHRLGQNLRLLPLRLHTWLICVTKWVAAGKVSAAMTQGGVQGGSASRGPQWGGWHYWNAAYWLNHITKVSLLRQRSY